MDCPKCVGRLQEFNLRLYKQEQYTIQPNIGKKWGTSTTYRIKGSGKPKRLELDKCFVCSGIWFDKGEIKKLKHQKVDRKTLASCMNDLKLYKQLNEKSGLCPKCKVPLRKMKGRKGFRNVTADICVKCDGIWLDGGEINPVLKGSAKGKLTNIWRFLWYDRFVPEKG